MLFSEKTQVNKIMPKAKFMKLTGLSTNVRNELQNNVERLILANVLNATTTNFAKGKDFEEIIVFEFLLKTKEVSSSLIKEIDSSMPKHILFVFKYGNEVQLAVSYKEKTSTENRYKVIKTYKTEWVNADKVNLEIKGLDIDAVFNNFITQLAGGRVEVDETTDIKQAVEKNIDKEKLLKKISQLENKIKKEPQFNKQLEMKRELKNLESTLENLYGKDEIRN